MINENRPKFVIETERVYKSFIEDIDLIRQVSPRKKTDMILNEVIISAYVKAYDFVLYMCSLNDFSTSFFQLPMLRGICEDFISLTYILSLETEKQNYLIITKRYEEINYSSKAQKEFFDKYNKGQIVLPILNEEKKEQILKIYRDEGYSLIEAKLPKIRTMAKQIGQIDLYNFIYHATSKVVHFDIMTLLSMGWGEINKENDTIQPNFSFKNDYRHYYTFALFYSSYLFIQQTKQFKDILNLPKKILENLKEIEDGYKNIDWPELLTFKQMNQKQPSELESIIYRFIKTKLNE